MLYIQVSFYWCVKDADKKKIVCIYIIASQRLALFGEVVFVCAYGDNKIGLQCTFLFYLLMSKCK